MSRLATEMALSVKTVSTHRTHILEKTGHKSNAKLMCYAMDHNLSA